MAAVFLLLGTAASCAGSRSLVISGQETGGQYGAWPLAEGAEFAIEFVHSVNQSPVRDTFRVEAGRIRPVETVFYSYGAGMQAGLEEGQTLTREGDALVIRGFTAAYKELNYIVGTVSDHLLCINNETISLRELCGRNAHIRIYIQ